MHPLYRAIVNGESLNEKISDDRARTVVFVRGDEYAHRPIHDFPDEFADKLEAFIEDNKLTHFCVVREEDAKLNVLKVDRVTVLAQLAQEIHSGGTSGGS